MSLINRLYAIIQNSPVPHYDINGNLKSLEDYSIELTYKIKDRDQNYFKYTNFKTLPTNLLRLALKPLIVNFGRWYDVSTKIRDEYFFDQAIIRHVNLELYEKSFSISHSYDHFWELQNNIQDLVVVTSVNLAKVPISLGNGLYLALTEIYDGILQFDSDNSLKSSITIVSNATSHLVFDGILAALKALQTGIINGLIINSAYVAYNSSATVGYGLSTIGETSYFFFLPLRISTKILEGIVTLNWPFTEEQPACFKARLYDYTPRFFNPLYNVEFVPIILKPLWWATMLCISRPLLAPPHINQSTDSLKKIDEYKDDLKIFLDSFSDTKNVNSVFSVYMPYFNKLLTSFDYDLKASALADHTEMLDYESSSNIKETYDNFAKSLGIINNFLRKFSPTKLIYEPWLKLTNSPINGISEIILNIIIGPFNIIYESCNLAFCITKVGMYSFLAITNDLLYPYLIPYLIKPFIIEPLKNFLIMPAFNLANDMIFDSVDGYIKPIIINIGQKLVFYINKILSYLLPDYNIVPENIAESNINIEAEQHLQIEDKQEENTKFQQEDYEDFFYNANDALIGIKNYLTNIVYETPSAVLYEFNNYWYNSDISNEG